MQNKGLDHLTRHGIRFDDPGQPRTAGLLNKEQAFGVMSSVKSHDPKQSPAKKAAWPARIHDLAGDVIAAATDIALVVRTDGVIEHVSFSDDERLRLSSLWVGRSFLDVVSPDSKAKARDLLAGIAAGPAKSSREINHPSLEGADLPVRYSAVRDGADGAIILLGRDLRPVASLQQRLVEAQQSMEREYARLRLAETRYRMVFHLSSEPILVVDGATLKIVEANPAAIKELALASDRLSRTSLLSLVSQTSSEPLQIMLRAARASGRGEDIEVLRSDARRRIHIGATAFRQDGTVQLLVRLRSHVPDEAGAAGDQPARQVHGMVEHAPDGCVIIAPDRSILHANKAFLELAQLASKQQAIGESLDRWLGRPGIDLALIQETLADHRVIRNFPTIVRGEFGGTEEVELSAVTAWAGDTGSTGFIIRSRAGQAALQPQRGSALPRSVEQLAELVGRVPLKELVRETSDVIEKLCIEAALDLSKDNRASAAQMLGLSRQSFYAKLRRHGLGDLGDDDGSG